MACGCNSPLPRRVPATDVGLRSSHPSASYKQLAREREGLAALRAPKMFAASRNPEYLGVNVHVGGARQGAPVRAGFSVLTLVLIGGAAWALTRAK